MSTDRQTDRQTDKQTNQRHQKHNLLCQGGNQIQIGNSQNMHRGKANMSLMMLFTNTSFSVVTLVKD